MARFVLRDELTHFRGLAREVEDLLRLDRALLTRPVAPVSAWSPLQHAAHMTLANELILRNLKSLTKGSGLLVVTEAAQSPAALTTLESGVIPRGKASAPRMVVPPLDVELETVAEWVAQFGAELESFSAEVPPGSVARCFVPHQLLGALDLCEWARFGVVHTRHHLVIAREIVAAARGET